MTVFLCEALAAIGNRKSGILNTLAPVLLTTLNNTLKKDQKEQLVVILTTLIFQAAKDIPGLSSDIENIATLTTQMYDHWVCYKIARQAARYGHHVIAAQIFSGLTNHVCSEHLHFWLIGLSDLCLGESRLNLSSAKQSRMHIDNLTEAITHYMRGISALKVL